MQGQEQHTGRRDGKPQCNLVTTVVIVVALILLLLCSTACARRCATVHHIKVVEAVHGTLQLRTTTSLECRAHLSSRDLVVRNVAASIAKALSPLHGHLVGVAFAVRITCCVLSFHSIVHDGKRVL